MPDNKKNAPAADIDELEKNAQPVSSSGGGIDELEQNAQPVYPADAGLKKNVVAPTGVADQNAPVGTLSPLIQPQGVSQGVNGSAQALPIATYKPKRLEDEILNKYPVLKKVAPADQFHIQYAQGDNSKTLQELGHNPEYISPNEGVAQEVTSNGIAIPKGKMLVNDDPQNPKFVDVNYPGHHTTLINPDGLSDEQIKQIAANDFLSHTLHALPEYNQATSELDKALKEKYGDKMVAGNGGVDAYVRSIIDQSSEYDPYRKEMRGINPSLIAKISDIIHQKESEPSILTKFLHGDVAGSQQGGISVKQDDGTIVTDHPTKGKLVETPAEYTTRTVKEKAENAHTTLANDVVASLPNMPQSYTDNVNTTSFTNPDSIVHEITNPHGNPETTGKYTQVRTQQIDQQKSQALAAYANQNSEDKVGNPEGYQQGLDAIAKQYDDQKNSLHDAASHTIDLQLTAKHYYTDKDYNSLNIGIEKQVLLGDPSAKKAMADIANGQPLNPADKYTFEKAGLQALQAGAKNAAVSGQHDVATEIDENSNNIDKRLEKDNPEYFTALRAHQIGNYIARNENPIYGTLFTHELRQEDIDAAAKKLGYTKAQIKDVTPENVPSSSSIYGQAAQGFTNNVVPLAKFALKSAEAGYMRVPTPEVPGEQNEAYKKLFIGNTPDYQNQLTISNPRSVLSSMANGIGALGGFVATSEAGGAALEGLGVAANTAAKTAQFATAAIPSYNEAYDKSKQLIGDNPADEGKRQLYAISNGIIGGAVMMIDPQANLGRDILGVTKAGQDFTKMIKDGGLENLTKPVLQNKYEQILEETAKHLGLQTSMPAIQTAAGNLTDMVLDPQGNHHIMDNVGDAAVSGAVAMFLPSLVAGIMHPRNQSMLNKGLMYEVGTNPYEYKKEIGSMVTAGKMSTDEAQTANEAIDRLHYIIGNQVPDENLSSQKLSQEQKQNYAWNLLQDTELQKKLIQAEGTKDKAQIDQVKSKIGELASERNKMLDKAGEITSAPKPPAPKQEEPTPAEKKDTEKLGNVKEDVSLNSSDNSQEKTTDNEARNEASDNNGRRETTDKGQGQDTNGESAQDRESGSEAGQDRPLSPAENETAPADEKPAGESVRKKRKLTPESQQEVPTTKTPDLAAWDLGDKEGLPKADHEQEIRDTPNDEKIGGGESFDEFRDRIKKVWDKLTQSAKDDALLVAHSGIMKMVAAAEKHGWDNTEELRKAYDNEPEPPVGKINQYETKNGTIHVTRHGQAEDNLDGNLREKYTPLTDKGREQAVEKVADQLKDKGITPSEIISSDLPRATETADIVKDEFAPETKENKKKKGKIWDFLEYQARRKKALEAEPKSLQEHILQTMLGMTDNHPERKWRFGESELKELPASERNSQKYYLNDKAPNNKSIDVWAQDLLNSIGEHDNPPYNLADHDSHSIRNEVIDAIKGHPTKNHVLEALEHLQESQRERTPEEHEYMASEHIAGVTDEHLHDTLNEEAQQLFGKVQEAISEDISPEDSDVLHKYLSSYIGEDGILQGEKIDPFEKDYQEAYDKLSKNGQRLLDTITELDPKKQRELLDQIKQKSENVNTNSKEQGAGPIQGTAEGNADKNTTKGAVQAEGSPGDKGEAKPAEGRKPVSFETSKGSVYKYDEDGNTTRFKTATGEQDEKQDLTVFVKFNSPEQQQDFLHGVQDRERTGTKVYVVDKHGKVYDKNADIKGKDVKLALYDTKANKIIDTVDTKQEPTVGYNTYDQRRFKQEGEDVRQSHIGNKVSKINYEEPAAKEQKATPERKPQIAPDKLSPNELIRKKQERLNKLHEDRLDLTDEKDELEAKLNTAQASTHPNADTIDELNSQLSDVNKRLKDKEAAIKLKEREIEIQKGYSQTADAIRGFADKNANNSKGMLGSFPLLNPKNASLLLNKVADLYEKFGNINIAAVRALEWAREHLADEKGIDKINEGHVRDLLNPYIRPLTDEPIIKMPEHLQVAKEWLDDIEKKRITYDEARKEILDSEGVSDKTKGNVQNWIDWHLKGGEPKERPKPEGLSFENDETSIKNDTTRLHRQQLGLDDEVQAAKKEFGESWSDAQKKIIEDPAYPQELIASLSKNPRPINDVENATLLHEQNRLRLRLKDIYADINKGADEGNEAAVAEGKVAKAGVLDKLQQIFDVNKAVGTENGRGLAARRMMVNDRYELTNMIAEKRANANDGKSLSEEQQAEVEKLHQKIQETQDAFDAYQRQKEAEIVKLQRQVLSSRQERDNSGNKSPKSQAKGEGGVLKSKAVADKLRAWADKQDKVIKNSAFSSPIPITPQMITKAVRLIADGIEKGGEVLDLVQQSIKKLRDDNPGVDETQLEKEINGALIDAGVSLANPIRKKALQAMTGLFKDGKLDHEAVRLNVAANRAKAEFDIEIKRDLEKQLSTKEKAQNLFIKWERAFKLSGPLTLGKLMNAGATRLLLTDPAESLVGGAVSKLIPRLANGAMGEGGGLNVKETAKAYTSGIMRGLKDAGQVLTKGNHGKSELDILFGKGGDLPPEAIEFFGTLHSAIKAPVKRAVFERQLEKRVRRNMDAGVDVSDPLVMTSIMDDSYKDANRAIFMQENKAAKWWNDGVRRMEQVDPVTGKVPTGNKVAATTMQWMMPFVKVSSNIVAETARGVYGLSVGAGQVLHAYITKNIENLSSDEKDVILRNLKKGSLGAAALSIGFFNPQNFGGYYQPGQKKKENDADWMGMKFGDTKLPAWLAEAPIFHLMQLGSTMRRVSEHYIKGEKEGIPAGVLAATMGVAQDNAMISEPVKLAKLFGSKYDRQQFVGETVKSTVVPALVSYLAKATDPADEGTPIRKALDPHNERKSPKTIEDHVKSGIPVLREDLDEK